MLFGMKSLEISATEFRKNFTSLLHTCHDEAIYVCRNGSPVAVLVGLDAFEDNEVTILGPEDE